MVYWRAGYSNGIWRWARCRRGGGRGRRNQYAAGNSARTDVELIVFATDRISYISRERVFEPIDG